MLSGALKLAERGLRVLPVDAATKRPLVKRGCHEASTDPKQIRAWWTRTPNAGVGVATGAVSGLVVIDVDAHRDGTHGIETVASELGQLPLGPTVTTPRGGWHRWLRLPEGAEISCSVDRLAPGVDVRGNGGYIVAPPTVGYRWQPTSTRELPVLPDEWADRLRSTPDAGVVPRRPVSEWTGPLRAGVKEGTRHDFMVRYCGHLFASRLEAEEIGLILQAINKTSVTPPLPDRELDGIVKWAARKEAARG